MATIEDLNNAYTKENNFLSKLTAPGGLKDKIEQFQQDRKEDLQAEGS